MLLANVATLAFCNLHMVATWILQEETMTWDPISLWKKMGILAKIVVFILFIMSGWSIGVMIDRYMAFNAARKQSRSFAPAVAGALRDGRFAPVFDKVSAGFRRKSSGVLFGLVEILAGQANIGAQFAHAAEFQGVGCFGGEDY